MMKIAGTLIALLLCCTACGTATDGQTDGGAISIDRSAVESVATGLLTAFLEMDLETVRELTLPEEQDIVDELIEVAELVNPTGVDKVDINAEVVSQSGDSAFVSYTGTYCLGSQITEIPVTTTGSQPESGTAPIEAVIREDSERCFDVAAMMTVENIEFRKIAGEWFGRLPQ